MPMPSRPRRSSTRCASRRGPASRSPSSDIDGILRGKYLHKDKFLSAVEGGFGFCDVVFGWDSHDDCYDNTTLTGWHTGYPDALARIDLATLPQRPWDDDVPFFLGDFVRHRTARRPLPLVPAPAAEARARRARRQLGYDADVRHGVRVVQLRRDAAVVGGEERRRSRAPHARHVRLLAPARERRRSRSSTRCSTRWRPSASRSRACTPRPAPASTRRRSCTPTRSRRPTARCCSRPRAKEIGARFGIMPTFMAKWNAQYPGCSGHIHQSLSDGKTNRLLRRQGPRTA